MILAHAGAEIAATEERDTRQCEECDREDNKNRVGEERGKSAQAKDGEAKISEGPHHGDEH